MGTIYTNLFIYFLPDLFITKDTHTEDQGNLISDHEVNKVKGLTVILSDLAMNIFSHSSSPFSVSAFECISHKHGKELPDFWIFYQV